MVIIKRPLITDKQIKIKKSELVPALPRGTETGSEQVAPTDLM